MSSRPLSDATCYRWRYVAGIALCFTGVALGSYLPDIDQMIRIPYLFAHRSIISHSFLMPLLLLGLVQAAHRFRPEGATVQLSHPHADPRLRLFTLGLCAALAVHFCFDLFPWAWRGYALIHVPIIGRLPWLLSSGWLLVSALVCLYFGSRLLRNLLDLMLVVGCLGAAWGITATHEPNRALYALLVLLFLAPLAFILPRQMKRRSL